MIKQENHVYLTIGNKMTLILRILLEISSKICTTYLLNMFTSTDVCTVHTAQLHVMHGMAWLMAYFFKLLTK